MSQPGPVSPIAKRKITGRGVMVGSVAWFMLAVALIFQSGELMTLSVCALLVLGGAWVLAPLNLRGLELRAELPPRFFAARKVRSTLVLLNRRRFGNAWSIEIAARHARELKQSGHATWTPAQSRSSLKEYLSYPARGAFWEVEHEIRSTFPLGLFEVRRKGVSECPVMVYPRLITPIEMQLLGSQSDHNPMSGAGVGDLFGEPRGIRPYQPGDKAALIHQFASARSVARGHGLQVRACDPPGFHPERCRILFHSYAKEGEVIRLDRFDRGLSLIAGTLAHFQGTQTKATLQADFTQWSGHPCENRAQYVACLALLATCRRARQTQRQELVETLHKAPRDEQLIVISDSPPEHWSALVLAIHPDAILVDIRQVRFERRQMQIQPAQAS